MEQVARIRLVLVADRPDLSAEEATGQGYILVDWGTPFMMAHSAHYPELPPPSLRLSQGLMALDLLRRVGGAAYLPRELVGQSIEAGELFEVADAPAIERFAYAAFRPGAGNRDLVTDALTGLRGGADG